jgi:biopolymer transport protein ExbD
MIRRRAHESESFDIPQTPLIDIIFILIIFFLVSTTFYTEERDHKIILPEGRSGDLITKESDKYVINIRQGGVIVVRQDILSMEQLSEDLKQRVEEGQTSVEIRGDTNARHGQVMAVMDLCKQLGINNQALTQRIVNEIE